MNELQAQRVLQHLYRIIDAGEKGYATAAANMPDPALKILLKLYAQQRFNFKNEILDELHRLGADLRAGGSLPGAVHRGRVAIFAAMASSKEGQQAVILKEAALGERVALRTYQNALAKDLPPSTRAMLERQVDEVRQASQQIQCLREDLRQRRRSENPQRRAESTSPEAEVLNHHQTRPAAGHGAYDHPLSAVRLSSSEHDTAEAVQALMSKGFAPDEIETLRLDDSELYQGRGATLLETILSGAVGGALWGGLMGLLAGFGVVQTINPANAAAAILAWLLTALAFMIIGALISSVLALFIGLNISGEDQYLYASIRENAQVLVRARTCDYSAEIAA